MELGVHARDAGVLGWSREIDLRVRPARVAPSADVNAVAVEIDDALGKSRRERDVVGRVAVVPVAVGFDDRAPRRIALFDVARVACDRRAGRQEVVAALLAELLVAEAHGLADRARCRGRGRWYG